VVSEIMVHNYISNLPLNSLTLSLLTAHPGGLFYWPHIRFLELYFTTFNLICSLSSFKLCPPVPPTLFLKNVSSSQYNAGVALPHPSEKRNNSHTCNSLLENEQRLISSFLIPSRAARDIFTHPP